MAQKAINITNAMTCGIKRKSKAERMKMMKRPKEPSSKYCDTSIAKWHNLVQKNHECKFKREYSKSSLEFWQTMKIVLQTEIADYRYQKKNLSKYFKLWVD